jgi:hypothetical protein
MGTACTVVVVVFVIAVLEMLPAACHSTYAALSIPASMQRPLELQTRRPELQPSLRALGAVSLTNYHVAGRNHTGRVPYGQVCIFYFLLVMFFLFKFSTRMDENIAISSRV